MQPIDPDFDLPSRRMTNKEFDERRAARTPEDMQQSRAADERLTTLINDLLYGSVSERYLAGRDGDVVVDETIIDTARPDGTLGVADDRYRSASSIAKFWARDKDRTVMIGNDEMSSGTRIGKSYLHMAGLIPFGDDDISIVQIESGRMFREESAVTGMRTWIHERTLEPNEGRTIVTNAITFVPRFAVPGLTRLLTVVLGAFFEHRHRRLRDLFAPYPTQWHLEAGHGYRRARRL